jgi:hypothetical protein
MKESDPTRQRYRTETAHARSAMKTEIVFAVKAMELKLRAKPEIVTLLMSPGIDSQPVGIDSLEFGLWYMLKDEQEGR